MLPRPLTSFVGRSAELARLTALVDDVRLVTLTGPGGCGKTRLAVELAGQRVEPVVFVDLAVVDDESAVAGLVADAVGAVSANEPLAAAVALLAESPTLLVLDNCEHVVEACALVVDALLRACRNVSVLATSREPLGVEGETTFRVPSLTDEDAIALFVERARRARPDFGGDPAVDEVCNRLDGIPLAIELAAARLRVLTTTQIRDGLNDRFRLLTGGARTAVPRQQTLQASVDWSYALLLGAERTVLDRLSVFAGGFTMEAAETVCAGGAVESHHVFDLVTALVDKSLVVGDDSGRFTLLETVRQYAATRLADSGDAPPTRARHYDHYCTVARRDRAAEDGHAWSTHISREYENIRRALQWADEQDDPADLARLVDRLYGYWADRRPMRDGIEWAGRAVTRRDELGRHARARLLAQFVALSGWSGGNEGMVDLAREAVATARETDDARSLLWTLLDVGGGFAFVHPTLGERADIHALVEETVELAEQVGDAAARSDAHLNLGFVVMYTDRQRAVDAFGRAVTVAEEAGVPLLARYARYGAVVLRLLGGEVASVRDEFECNRELLRDGGNTLAYRSALEGLCQICVMTGDLDRLASVVDDCHALAAEAGDDVTAWQATQAQQWLAIARGDFAAARDALVELSMRLPNRSLSLVAGPLLVCALAVGDAEACEDLAREVRDSGSADPTLPASLALADVIVARQHGDEVLDELVHRLVADSHTNALGIQRLWAVTLLGVVEAEAGRSEVATRIFGSAHAQAVAVGVSTETPLWRHMDLGQIEALRAALGDARFTELWAEGEALDRDALLAYVQRGRGARKRPVSGWASLTPTEVDVVELVGSGATNREVAERLFMSVPTVKSHLTHVYAKLGLSSRSQLAAAASARRTSTTPT